LSKRRPHDAQDSSRITTKRHARVSKRREREEKRDAQHSIAKTEKKNKKRDAHLDRRRRVLHVQRAVQIRTLVLLFFPSLVLFHFFRCSLFSCAFVSVLRLGECAHGGRLCSFYVRLFLFKSKNEAFQAFLFVFFPKNQSDDTCFVRLSSRGSFSCRRKNNNIPICAPPTKSLQRERTQTSSRSDRLKIAPPRRDGVKRSSRLFVFLRVVVVAR